MLVERFWKVDVDDDLPLAVRLCFSFSCGTPSVLMIRFPEHWKRTVDPDKALSHESAITKGIYGKLTPWLPFVGIGVGE